MISIHLLGVLDKMYDRCDSTLKTAPRLKGSFYFVHIGKTGGGYLKSQMRSSTLKFYDNETLGSRNPHSWNIVLDDHPRKEREGYVNMFKKNRLKHSNPLSDVDIVRKEYKEANIKFTIVRNPYSHLVSIYNFGWGSFWNKRPGVRPFKEVLHSLCCNESKDNNFGFLQDTLYFQILDCKQTSVVDFYFRQELLDDALQLAFLSNSLDYTKDESLAKGTISDIDYREYYDDESIEWVSEKFSQELSFFKYDFDGIIPGYETPVFSFSNRLRFKL